MNLEGITARFQSIITGSKVIPKGITEEHRQRILGYINASRSNQYKTMSGDLDTCEQQQYYLADPRLPSHSGVLTGKSRAVSYLKKEYVEIPTWAVRLGLLRKANYTLTERGRVSLALQSNISNLFNSEKPDENPYLLTPSDKYFFLFCLLDVDGDIIKRLYRRLVLHPGPFGRKETGGYMIESLAELKDEIKKRRLHITYTTLSNEINNTIEVIKKTDQAIVPRLEPLVDCGLLRRSSQQDMEYQATNNANVFIQNLNLSGSIDEFLNENLAVNTVDLLGLKFEKKIELVPRYIARSYARLRSGIGYCSIKDLAILAVAYSIGDGFGIFEIGDVERAIIDFYKTHGTNVRFTQDRQGNLALVRFDASFVREISGAG
jgi:hypothetical protein